ELILNPDRERFRIAACGRLRKIPEAAPLRGEDARDPARLRHDVENVREREPRRHREAVLDVVMALADHLQIDREYERRAFRGGRALDQALDEFAVAHDIKLKPERQADGARDIL